MAGFVTKTWTDRQSTYPSRRRLTATGTTDIYDVSREEGTVTQTGDAFSATNMNDLESRIEDFSAITPSSYSLYSNASGTQATITLSETATNFSYFEVYHRDDDWSFAMTKVYSPHDKRFCLNQIVQWESYIYWKSARVYVNGTSLTWDTNRYAISGTNSGSVETRNIIPIYILYVVGYK